MKKLLSVAASIAMLATMTSLNASAESEAVPVEIDEAAYQQLVERSYCDTNEDGILTEEELYALTSISLDLDGVTDLSWLSGMTKLTSLSLSNGSMTDLSFLSEYSQLIILNLNNVPVDDISFVREMNLQYCNLNNMDQITDEQKLAVMKFSVPEIKKGYSAVAGALPSGLFDYNEISLEIEDTSIACFDINSVKAQTITASSVYGKEVGTTKLSLYIKREEAFSGNLTVNASDVYSPELHEDGYSFAEEADCYFYGNGKLVLADSTLYTMSDGTAQAVESNVKAIDSDYCYDELRKTVKCDIVLFNDGTVKINGTPLETELRFSGTGDACFITEEGDLYSLRCENGKFLLDFVYSGFSQFLDHSSMFFLSSDGEVVLKELLYIDNGGISYQAFETGIIGLTGNYNDYFIDSDKILWYVDRNVGNAPDIVKKAEDVVYVGYQNYSGGAVYGCVHITSDGTAYKVGTTSKVTIYEENEEDNYIEAGIMSGGLNGAVGSQLTLCYNYHISLDNVLYMEYNGQQTAVSGVDNYVTSDYDENKDALYVYFIRTDGSLWTYSFADDKYTEITFKSDAPLMGDVNLDGEVNVADAVKLQKHLVNVNALTAEQAANADIITDNTIDVFDFVGLRKLLTSK